MRLPVSGVSRELRSTEETILGKSAMHSSALGLTGDRTAGSGIRVVAPSHG